MIQHVVDAVVQLDHRGLERAGGPAHRVFKLLQIGQRIAAGDGFNAPHARGHAAFAGDLEQANVAGALHVRAAAQLAAAADVKHAHRLAILLAKQHGRAGFLGRFDVHHAGLRGRIRQDFGVDAFFNLLDFRIGHRAVVGKVKPGVLRIHQTALLLYVVAQHFAQRLVHDVGHAVVAHGRGAALGVDLGCDLIAHSQGANCQCAVVAIHVGLDFLGVIDGESGCNRSDIWSARRAR